MRAKRWRGWGIDLFLWVGPGVGLGVFVGMVLKRPAPLPRPFMADIRSFDLPGQGAVALAVVMIGLPLIVALWTRRLLGFLAALCLLGGIAAVAGWVNSHWASRDIALVRVTGPPAPPRLGAVVLSSRCGGVALRRVSFDHAEQAEAYREGYTTSAQAYSVSLWAGGPEQEYPSLQFPYGSMRSLPHRMGFALAVHPDQVERAHDIRIPFAVALPYWFLCLLTLPFPLAWTMRLRRRRRIARRARLGLCRQCGYDLRATPDSSGARLPVCPECGAAAEQSAAAGRTGAGADA